RALYLRTSPLERLAQRATQNPDDAQLLELAGRRLLEAHRPGEARALLEPQMSRLGNQVWLQTLLGRACLETASPKEAYAHLQVALMLRPEDPDAHCWLAETLRQQGRTEEAAAHDRRVTELAPGRGEPWLRLGARALK